MGELELFAGAQLVAPPQGVDADEESGRAFTIDPLGRRVRFGRHFELAGRDLAEQEPGDRAWPFGEIFAADSLGEGSARIAACHHLGGIAP